MVGSLNFQNSRNTVRSLIRVFSSCIHHTGSHIPFNFDLILHTKIWTPTIANDFKAHIDAWEKTLPKDKGVKSNWVVMISQINYPFCKF